MTKYVSKFQVQDIEPIYIKDEEARNDIALIKQQIADFTYGKYIFIGDSYATGLTPTGEVTGWPEFCVQSLGLSASDYFISRIGGSGFTAGKTFLQLLQDAVNHFDNNDDVKYIVVAGGFNDRGSNVEVIKAAISAFCTYAKTHFPSAEVYIGMIGWSTDGAIRGDLLNVSRAAYMQCSGYGATYLQNVQYVLHDYSLCANDYTHATQEGYRKIGFAIAEALTAGYSAFYPLRALSAGTLGPNVTNVEGLPNVILNNNTVTIIGGKMTVSVNNISIDGGAQYKICNILPDAYIQGSNYPWVTSINVILYCEDTSGQFKSVPAILWFENNEMKIEHRETTGMGFFNFTNVRTINIWFGSQTITADYC